MNLNIHLLPRISILSLVASLAILIGVNRDALADTSVSASYRPDALLALLEAPPLSDEELSQYRGGFDTGTGLIMSFGIERAVYFNGQLVTSTTVNPLTTIMAAGVLQSKSATPSQWLSSNGADVSTIIQNSLNNQTIRAVTVINASSNSLGLMKSLNFGSTLRDAINASAR